jgi:hypothetical protein
MGMGNAQQQNQVYFDPQTNQYYTQSNPYGAYGMPKNFLTGLLQLGTKNEQKSPINDLVAKAMAAKPNAPTLQSLFPNMGNQSMMNYQAPMQAPMMNPMAGQYGAGRFLGGNSMSSGMTSNAMNTM